MTTPTPKFSATLRDLRRAGVYQIPNLSTREMEEGAIAAGMSYVRCDFGETEDLVAALSRIGKSLGFPDWYGENLDALHDCLTDLSWRGTPETVLVITRCEVLRNALPEAFDAMVEVFSATSDFWKEEKRAFWVFLETCCDGIETLRVA